MVWYFIGVYIIKRTLHCGGFGDTKFLSHVEKYNFFISTLEEKFRISAWPYMWYPLLNYLYLDALLIFSLQVSKTCIYFFFFFFFFLFFLFFSISSEKEKHGITLLDKLFTIFSLWISAESGIAMVSSVMD